jgi:hypothetical protein
MEEIHNRKSQVIEHIKVVREFALSNIPILFQCLCEHWENELHTIRTKESQLSH